MNMMNEQCVCGGGDVNGFELKGELRCVELVR